jgi:hypothetical protein
MLIRYLGQIPLQGLVAVSLVNMKDVTNLILGFGLLVLLVLLVKELTGSKSPPK